MALKTDNDFSALMKELPASCGGFSARTATDLLWELQIELDLIEEGQEAAECYSKADVARMRRTLTRWKTRLGIET